MLQRKETKDAFSKNKMGTKKDGGRTDLQMQVDIMLYQDSPKILLGKIMLGVQFLIYIPQNQKIMNL